MPNKRQTTACNILGKNPRITFQTHIRYDKLKSIKGSTHVRYEITQRDKYHQYFELSGANLHPCNSVVGHLEECY